MMSTDAIRAVTRAVAMLSREISELKTKHALIEEQNRMLIQALATLNARHRARMEFDEPGTPSERARAYKRNWMRNKRARLRNAGLSAQ